MSARRRVLESRMPSDDEEPASTSLPSPSGRGTPLPAPQEPVGPASPRSSVAPLTSRWVGKDRAEIGPRVDAPGGGGTAMSPRMTALFGGLFGLATVTTIIALLIQSSPPRDDRADAAAVAAASGSAALAGGPEAPAAALAAPKKRVRTKIPGPPRVADLAKSQGWKLVDDTIQRRSFITALSEKGVPKDQIYRVLKAFDGIKKFDKLGKNDRFVVALDRQSNAIKGFEYIVSPLEVLQAVEADGLLVASTLDMKIAEEEVTGSIYVGKDLTKSIQWAGFEPDLIRVMDEALAGRTSHESFAEGGILKVVATETTALGEFVKYKGLVALEYRPPDPGAQPTRAYTFAGTGARGYFDDKGRQPDGSGWASPVPGAPITSRFNPKRLHPVLKKVMPHNGTDYGAPTGTPIVSVYRGKLTFVGNAGPCGNMVAIKHPNGIESGYCHMHKIAPGLKVGGSVGTRQVLGQVGTTGRSTGPHLHFWVKKDGKYFDSETLKIDGFRVVPLDERGAFATRKAELDARLDAMPLPDPPPVDPAPVAKVDDTRPDVGDAPDSDAASDAAEPAKGQPKKAKADADPTHVDPGDGDDLVGPDLRK